MAGWDSSVVKQPLSRVARGMLLLAHPQPQGGNFGGRPQTLVHLGAIGRATTYVACTAGAETASTPSS